MLRVHSSEQARTVNCLLRRLISRSILLYGDNDSKQERGGGWKRGKKIGTNDAITSFVVRSPRHFDYDSTTLLTPKVRRREFTRRGGWLLEEPFRWLIVSTGIVELVSTRTMHSTRRIRALSSGTSPSFLVRVKFPRNSTVFRVKSLNFGIYHSV